MKTTISTLCGLLLLIQVDARPPGGPGGRPSGGPGAGPIPRERGAERAAMREELLLDHLDTHKWKKDPEATDVRPEDLGQYHNRTYQRIVRLLTHGAITEENGKAYKEKHTEITQLAQGARTAGNFTPEMQTEVRGMLDALNDEINAALKAAEEGANRTPILNRMQHRFEEKIEFGERSGRLSQGEVGRLKRMVEKLKRLEERAKEGNLSTRDREKLFAEAGQIASELEKALLK
jgi:hypothetical protein